MSERHAQYNDKIVFSRRKWADVEIDEYKAAFKLYDQKQYKEAEGLFQQAVQGQEKELGKNHVVTLNSKLWLGRTFYEQKQYKEAEGLFRQVMQGQEKVLSKNHINTMDTKHWLGRTLYLQKKYSEAKEHGLLHTYYTQKKYSAAEELLRQVVQEQEKELGKTHVDTLISKHWLGRTLYDQNKYEEAKELLQQSMQGQEKELGKNHVDTLNSKLWLGRTLYLQKRVFGSENTKTPSIKHCLGCTFYEQENVPNFCAGTSASIEEYADSSLKCLHCRILLDAIDQLYPGWIGEQQDMKFVEICDIKLSWNLQPYIQLRLAGEGLTGTGPKKIEIRIDTDGDLSWSADPCGFLSRTEWEQTGSWIKDCINSHAICRRPNPRFVPKRLVQVMDGDSNLHLVEKNDLGQRCANYCALSYCWGPQGNPVTTRKENLRQHLKGMSLSSMPQTIQDAIIICRSIKIPYLWVDALCIVQDDDSQRDWYEQSSEMCEIYSNAHLVISADASPSSNFGFLPGRDHTDRPWKTVRVFDATNNRQVIASVRTHEANTGVSYKDIPWNGKSIHPLLQRGWALQESLLANRLLRFTSHGMKWECNQVHQDQMSLMARTIRLAKLTRIYPNMEFRFPQSELSAIYGEEEIHSHHITDFMSQNTSASIYHAWQEVVTYYSSRDLTEIADKLSALSGLARLISEALPVKPDAYLAGHWRDDLASSLLWYVSRPDIPNRSSPYRAPSWSWVSVNGEIKYFHEQYQFHFTNSLTVHSAQCQPSPLDPFGRVTFGKISVTGSLVPVRLYILPTKDHKTHYTGISGCAGHPYTDQFSWVTLLDGLGLEHVDPVDYYEVLLDDKISRSSLDSANIRCLLIGKHHDTKTGGCRVWWLVLRQTLADSGCWERIGIGYFQEYSRELELFDSKWTENRTITLL